MPLALLSAWIRHILVCLILVPLLRLFSKFLTKAYNVKVKHYERLHLMWVMIFFFFVIAGIFGKKKKSSSFSATLINNNSKFAEISTAFHMNNDEVLFYHLICRWVSCKSVRLMVLVKTGITSILRFSGDDRNKQKEKKNEQERAQTHCF